MRRIVSRAARVSDVATVGTLTGPPDASICSTSRLNKADSEMPWQAATADNRRFTSPATQVDK